MMLEEIYTFIPTEDGVDVLNQEYDSYFPPGTEIVSAQLEDHCTILGRYIGPSLVIHVLEPESESITKELAENAAEQVWMDVESHIFDAAFTQEIIEYYLPDDLQEKRYLRVIPKSGNAYIGNRYTKICDIDNTDLSLIEIFPYQHRKEKELPIYQSTAKEEKRKIKPLEWIYNTFCPAWPIC